MASLSDVPAEVLKIVMQHLQRKDRLGSCCLVSKRFHAAVAATESMQLVHTTPESAKWDLHHITSQGHHLTRLILRDVPQPLRSLPCPNLQELCVLGQGIVHL